MGLSMMGINDYGEDDMAHDWEGRAGREISKLRKRIKDLTVQNHQLTAAYCDLKEEFDILDTELDRMEHAEVERLYRERESKGTSSRASKS